MRTVIRFLLGLTACCMLLFAGSKMAEYIRESRESVGVKESLIEMAVAVNPQKPTEPAAREEAPEESQAEEETVPHETAPIAVDFDVLKDTNTDIIGWLYSEDTPINLPVAQSGDNDYYLRRLIDGSWNSGGTLFADYRNSGDFADTNTVIYGHNMKNKEMFGTLANYKEQSYYEEHPVMWLLTPTESYRVELVAGYVVSATSEVYAVDQSEQEVLASVKAAIAGSTFDAGISVGQGDRFVTLSTCSYEYDEARYVVIGRLVPLV